MRQRRKCLTVLDVSFHETFLTAYIIYVYIVKHNFPYTEKQRKVEEGKSDLV